MRLGGDVACGAHAFEILMEKVSLDARSFPGPLHYCICESFLRLFKFLSL
jgi:hypothetical protein